MDIIANLNRLSGAKSASLARSPVLLLGSLCLLQAATGFNWSVYFAFGGLFLRAKLGYSVPTVALLLSSSFLIYCGVQFGASLLLDAGVRLVGVRTMLLRSPIFYGLGMTLFVLGATSTTLVVGSGLMGLGAATMPLMLVVIAATMPKRASGQMVSVLGVSYLAGQLIALGAGWLVISQWPVQTVFDGLCAGWAVVVLIMLVTFRVEPPEQPRQTPLGSALAVQLRTSLSALWQSLGDPRTRALKFIILVAGVAPVLAGIYIPLYLIQLVNDSARSAGYIVASTALGYVLGGIATPLLGTFTDRRRNASEVLLIVLVLVTIVALALSRTPDPIAVSVLTVALTVGGQCLNMLQSAILLWEVPAENSTTFFAASQLPFYGGLPLGLGLGIGAVGLTGSVANALLVVAGMFALSAAVWWWHVRAQLQR